MQVCCFASERRSILGLTWSEVVLSRRWQFCMEPCAAQIQHSIKSETLTACWNHALTPLAMQHGRVVCSLFMSHGTQCAWTCHAFVLDATLLFPCAGAAELSAADSELETTRAKLTQLVEVELVQLQQEMKDIQVCTHVQILRKKGREEGVAIRHRHTAYAVNLPQSLLLCVNLYQLCRTACTYHKVAVLVVLSCLPDQVVCGLC